MASRFLLVSFLAATMTGAQASEFKFIQFDKSIGCGTIEAVFDVPQKPIYDAAYHDRFHGKGSTSGAFAQAAGGGFMGIGAAFVRSIVADAAVSAATKKDAFVLPETKHLDDVQTLRVMMDDGAVMHLPLMRRGTLSGFKPYKQGQRVWVFFHDVEGGKTYHLDNSSTPSAGDWNYKARCTPRSSPEWVAAAIEHGKVLGKLPGQEDKHVAGDHAPAASEPTQ